MNLLKITNKHSAAEYFTKLSNSRNMGTSYRVLSSAKHGEVISNVPPVIYEHQKLKKYIPPQASKPDNNDNFINFLQEAFDFFQNQSSTNCTPSEEKLFNYNKCYNNSLRVHYCLGKISSDNGLPVTFPACLCFGYMSKVITPGGVIGQATISMENLIVHDWHAWNMINNFIIDLSIPKNGGIYELTTKQIQWQKAEDHVFKHPPVNITYSGINFTEPNEFTEFTSETFEIH